MTSTLPFAVGLCGMALLLPATVAAQSSLQTEVLQGTVVDEQGAPVAGVTVDILRREAEGFVCLDLEYGHSVRKVRTLHTGKLGTFAIELPRGEPYYMHIDDGVHAPIVRSVVYGGEVLNLRLEAPARIALSLRDVDGKPTPGVLSGWNGDGLRFLAGKIDAQGRWHSERLPSGAWTLDVAPDRAMRPGWQRLLLEPGVELPLALELQVGVAVRGRIVDSVTGKPIAGARIGEGWTQDKFVLSDADGNYEMLGYGAEGYGELYVRAEGFGVQAVDPKAESPTTRKQDFALVPCPVVTGRVLQADGSPAVGVYVAGVGLNGDGQSTFDWSGVRADAAGRFRLVSLRAQTPHTLLVHQADGADLLADMPDLGDQPLQLPDLKLRAGQYVSGRVVDDSGAPVAGVEVTLSGCNPDRGTLLGRPAGHGNIGADYCLKVRTMHTDSGGRIHFAHVAPGGYRLGWRVGRKESGVPVEVVAGVDPDPVVFTGPR